MKPQRNLYLVGGVLGGLILIYLIISLTSSSAEGRSVDLTAPKTSVSDTIELSRQVNHQSGGTTSAGSIVVDEARLCLKVENQAPVAAITRLPSGVDRIYFWARLNNGKGRKIRYIWHFDNKITTSAWQVVTSNRFRSWCPFSFNANIKGQGRVELVQDDGALLTELKFQNNGRSQTPPTSKRNSGRGKRS